MIELIFTVDYEILGNGRGSLRELVYEPADKLKTLFDKYGAHFVTFVEAAELEMIEAERADQAIDLVKQQICDFHKQGFETGLHIHPQWYNGRYAHYEWLLDYEEYNLCTLHRARIAQIVERSIDYLRKLLGAPNFTPIAFRAGNWLLQPAEDVAVVLVEHGIKVDSSVYKGGLQHHYKLDYRRALKNGYYWPFSEDVNIPDLRGRLVEIPTYTNMVPMWKLLSRKRIGLRQKGVAMDRIQKKRHSRLRDFMRLWQPMKLDYCRLTIKQLTRMLDKEIQKDKIRPEVFRPIIAIGHTKDLNDLVTVDAFLAYLKRNQIRISTFGDVYGKCNQRA